MTRFMTAMSTVIALVVSLSLSSATAAANRLGDHYLAGYAAAILEMRFGLTRGDLPVENGRLALDPSKLEGHNVEEVLASLDAIEGLEVTVAEAHTGPSDALEPGAEASLPTTAGWLPKT